MVDKNGFDNSKRWGNSAKGHGVNSPAMMEARKGFAKKDRKAGYEEKKKKLAEKKK